MWCSRNSDTKNLSQNVKECLKEGPAWVAYQSTVIESLQRLFSWNGVEYQIEHLEAPVQIGTCSFSLLRGLD